MLTWFTVKGKPFPSLINATLDDLTKGLEQGLFTSVDLVKVGAVLGRAPSGYHSTNERQAYVARINQVNDHLHAITEINPDALDIAKSLDNERAKGSVRG